MFLNIKSKHDIYTDSTKVKSNKLIKEQYAIKIYSTKIKFNMKIQ